MGNSLLVAPAVPKVTVPRTDELETPAVLTPGRGPRFRADWLMVKDEIFSEELLDIKLKGVDNVLTRKRDREKNKEPDQVDVIKDALQSEQYFLQRKTRRRELEKYFHQLHRLDKANSKKTTSSAKERQWMKAMADKDRVVHDWDPDKTDSLDELLSKLRDEQREILQDDDWSGDDEAFEWPTESDEVLERKILAKEANDKKHGAVAENFLNGDITLEEACWREINLKRRAQSNVGNYNVVVNQKQIDEKRLNNHVKDLLELVDPNELTTPRGGKGSPTQHSKGKAQSPAIQVKDKDSSPSSSRHSRSPTERNSLKPSASEQTGAKSPVTPTVAASKLDGSKTSSSNSNTNSPASRKEDSKSPFRKDSSDVKSPVISKSGDISSMNNDRKLESKSSANSPTVLKPRSSTSSRARVESTNTAKSLGNGSRKSRNSSESARSNRDDNPSPTVGDWLLDSEVNVDDEPDVKSETNSISQSDVDETNEVKDFPYREARKERLEKVRNKYLEGDLSKVEAAFVEMEVEKEFEKQENIVRELTRSGSKK